MKKGLVMEGGAMRGMFTCGVIDVFMEQGIDFDGASGISAGAVFGCNIKSKQIGRGIRYNKKYGADPRYCSFSSLLKTGDLYPPLFCYRELPEVLDPFDKETFRNNPMEFYIGATDIETGRIVYHKCTDGGDDDILWMQASASMPLAANPVEIKGKFYLDGGVSDSVPYRYLETKGYDRNVIILTQAAGYRKKKSPAVILMHILMKKYPALIKAMETRHIRYNKQMEELDERERTGKALVIRPPKPLGISRTENNPEELERVYQIGRREALRRLEEIKSFLS